MGEPRFIGAILDQPLLPPAAQIALVSAYAVGGVAKLLDFPAAIQEQAHLGLIAGFVFACLPFRPPSQSS